MGCLRSGRGLEEKAGAPASAAPLTAASGLAQAGTLERPPGQVLPTLPSAECWAGGQSRGVSVLPPNKSVLFVPKQE